ncbi:MAG TPA: hypothetical protein VGP13_01105 [Candidatus Paceibacterota bacterium]|jgi:hypothetical protein|nr:hypothetical protein [Candidatus Paceibacterota bacterium]
MISKEALVSKLLPLEPYLLPAVIVLVGVGAFGLGRLSAQPQNLANLRIIYPDAQAATPVKAGEPVAAPTAPKAAPAASGNYVASKSGTKYYLTTCSGVSRIKDENKVYFATAGEAVAAGYGPAANCPGL